MKIKDFISKYDTQDQFTVLRDTYKQVEYAWNNKVELSSLKNKNFSSIVFCGLGGSAISGDLLNDFLSTEINLPFNVVRGYYLPAFVNENTLIIISSYSGNTEETISCIEQSLKKNCSIVVITSGGKILDIAVKNKIPAIKIIDGFQPRYALGLSFFSVLKLMNVLGFSDDDKFVKQVIDLWKKRGEEFSSEKNIAIQAAENLIGFIPVIYSSEFLSSTGYRFKCQLNENSKIHAFQHILPEMNHNEIIGWETFSEKQFNVKVIYLNDEDYHPQNKKRFIVLKELIESKKAEIINLHSNEEHRKVRIMDLIFLCDWISFYLAVLRGFDPSEIDFIHEMKKSLA
ncbi:MAG: bifunctional phosphoglucose/phosphomannose isomerase [Ignavibacteriales bacterium]